MELETLKWATAQGLGFVIAVVVGYFYRQDHATVVQLQRDTVQLQKDTLSALVANTAAMEKLTAAVDRSIDRPHRGAATS